MTRSILLATTIALWLNVILVESTTQHWNLELQSDCLSSEELHNILSDRFLPALQKLVSSTESTEPTQTGTLGRLFAPQASSSSDSNFPLAFSISSGDNRRNLVVSEEHDLTDNTTVSITDAPMLRGWEEEDENTEISTPITAALNCPAFSECPCSGCPGHWCLVFCGFAGGQRKLLLGPTPEAIPEEPLLHRRLRANVFRRRDTIIPSELQPTVPYCGLIERVISDMEDTCLLGATVLRCSVA